MLECLCSLGRWSDNAMSYQLSVRAIKFQRVAFESFPCFKKKWAHLENLTNLRSQASLRKPCGSLITSESLNRVQPKNKNFNNAFLILDGIAAQPEGTFFKLLARIIVDAKYFFNRKVRALITENYFKTIFRMAKLQQKFRKAIIGFRIIPKRLKKINPFLLINQKNC